MNAYNHLSAFLQGIYPLSDAEMAATLAVWQPFSARRKEILTPEGQTERYAYFVLEGVQRACFTHPDGRDITLVFTYPYSFSGIADSFLLQKPSKFTFETLTPSQFLRAPYAAIKSLMDEHRNIERLLFRATAVALEGVLYRQAELQSFSSEEKFRALLARSPHVLTLIPHKYLASYIGVDATNFSKLLNSIRIA